MRRPGSKIVSVYRQGPRNRDGDATTVLVGTYGGVSVQQTATREDTLDGRAERVVTNWTLVMPPGIDVRASDRLTVHNYTGGRELHLVVDGHPHEPEFVSGRPTNTIVRAMEVDTV